jgi:hypothetical protein
MWKNRFYLAFIGIGFNSLFGKPEKFIRIACTSFNKFIENDLPSPKINAKKFIAEIDVMPHKSLLDILREKYRKQHES